MRWAIAAGILFVLLSWYGFSQYEKYYPTVTGFSQNPRLYDGRGMEIEGRVIEDNGTYFMVGTSNIPLELSSHPDLQKAVLGSVNIAGTLSKKGILVVKQVHIENYHHFKYILSVLAFGVFFWFFLREWKISLRGFEDA